MQKLEEDSRTHSTMIKCPYCFCLLDRMENPDDFVDATSWDRCEKCGHSFYVVLRWTGFTQEAMRAGNVYYRKNN